MPGLRFFKYTTVLIRSSHNVFGKCMANKIEQTKDMRV